MILDEKRYGSSEDDNHLVKLVNIFVAVLCSLFTSLSAEDNAVIYPITSWCPSFSTDAQKRHQRRNVTSDSQDFIGAVVCVSGQMHRSELI